MAVPPVNGTEKRKFVYRSFNDRVASLKIDPIRITGKKWEQSEDESSFFITAFDHWRELNLSKNFTDFAYKCYPFCKSLPMIFHHQTKIADVLAEHLRAADQYSLEPLSDLVTKFARDLGADFEPFFGRFMEIIIQILADVKQQPDLDLIENCFYCLAYLFKYLSRLLVTDLIPTFDFLAPLFGKSGKQPTYILRFAAESLSFLIRKCSPESLHQIILHVMSSLEEAAHSEYYLKSISILFANSLKSTGNNLHSKAPVLLMEMLRCTSTHKSRARTDLMCSVLVDVLHHTRKDTAEPIYETTVNFLQTSKDAELEFRLLFILGCLRKGDRVSNWAPILECLLRATERCAEFTLDSIMAISGVLSLADFSDTSKVFHKLIKSLQGHPVVVMQVYECIRQQNIQVFNTFIVGSSITKVIESCSDLSQIGVFLNEVQPYIPSDKPWRLSKGEKIPMSFNGTDYGVFELWWHYHAFQPVVKPTASLIIELLNYQVSNSSYKGLHAQLIGELIEHASLKDDELELIYKKLPELQMRKTVLTGLARHVRAKNPRNKEYALIAAEYCASWDQDIRRAAVDLCNRLAHHELVNECLVIDDIPRDLNNERNLALRIRNLAAAYTTTGANNVCDAVVPRVMFGLLASRFQPIWKAVLEVIGQVFERNEKLCWDLAYQWITAPPHQMRLFEAEDLEIHPKPLGYSYDCTNLDGIDKLVNSLHCQIEAPVQSLKRLAADLVNIAVYEDFPALAYKALIQVPKVAEAHGNELVPLFLGGDSSDDLSNVGFNDRLNLLELFSKFRKPSKLDRFDEIYDIYLTFLSSTHVPLQKPALACILAVNNKQTDVLRKYRASFEQLIDRNRFKEEIAVLFTAKDDDDQREHSLHEGDRSAVLPVATRILYGHAKVVKSSTGGTKSGTRFAVLSAINSYFEPQYQRLFVELATKHVDFSVSAKALKRQQGLLSLVLDFIDVFRTNVVHTLDLIIPALIKVFNVIKSCDEDDNTDAAPPIVKSMRQSSTRSLDKLLELVPDRQIWDQYFEDVYASLIAPRVDGLGKDNLEQASALSKTILTLSSEMELVDYLRIEDGIIIRRLFESLRFERVKEPVVKLVFTVGTNLVEHNVPDLIELVRKPVISAIPSLIGRGFAPQTVELMVTLLNSLALDYEDFDADALNAIIDAELVIFKNNTVLPSPVKVALLESLKNLLAHPLCSEATIEQAYVDMARLFRQFSDPKTRVKLCDCYVAFGQRLPKFERIGGIVAGLNSFNQKRMGLPDFDKRLEVFADVNEGIYNSIESFEWLVLLYNALFFMKDPEELALRNNGVYMIKRLVQVYGTKKHSNFEYLFKDILIPAVRLGMREQNATFRELFVEILAAMVVDASEVIAEAQELRPLLMDDDAEANFFNNIFHIQIHRRLRAVQRLAVVASDNNIEETVVAQYLIPLIEHLALESSKKHQEINSLANESVLTISALSKLLTFNQFKALSRRYVSTLLNKPMEIKKTIKLVNAVAQSVSAYVGKVTENALSQFALNDIANPLHKLMSLKTTNEENLTERVSLAIPTVLFLNVLPSEKLEVELPGKLTWICQLLRAKSQELRDLVRNTIGKLALILGSEYFTFIVKELKGALTRGPQLHVLGYTMHSLLVTMKPKLVLGSLDSSAALVISIIMEDIFGATGQDKENENYITGAKEVKSCKSYDSGFLMAESVSMSQFGELILPLRDFLLSRKLNLKTERKMEDLLHRFSNGLRKNADAQTQTGVIAMYQINEMCLNTVSEEHKKAQELDHLETVSDQRAAKLRAAKESEDFHTVKLKMHKVGGASDDPSRKHVANLHLLRTFVLDSLRIVLGAEGLLNPANIKGLLPIIEAGIDSPEEDIQIAALKLASFCLKVPMSDISERCLTIGRRTLALIKTTSSTSSELCQVCLKLLTVILRSVEEFKIKDSAYAYILDRTKADIEEPERQSTTIGFIRALLAAKVMIPELYDVMDKISNVMVTNQDPVIRTACRSAYLRFLLDYPHGQARLDKYFAFLVSNLEYTTSTGRLSVLEMIRMVVTKVHEDQTDHALTSFFVGLVLVLVNDSDPQCRSAAEQLVGQILERSDDAARRVIVDFCISWLSFLGHNNSMVRATLELAPMLRKQGYLDQFSKLSTKLGQVVEKILQQSQKGSGEENDWQLIYLSLKFLSDDLDAVPLDIVESTLLFPHPWVRSISARIFGTWYARLKQQQKQLSSETLNGHAKRFVRQLGAPLIADVHGNQVVKNLLFIVQSWQTQGSTFVLKDGTEQPGLEYLVKKLGTAARTEINSDEFVGSKQAIVQLFAALGQVLEAEQLPQVAGECITTLYLLEDQLRSDKRELRELCQAALEIFSSKLGTTEYLRFYNASRMLVDDKRRERRAKRAIEAVNNPEAHVRKKLKKNANLRNSRKRKAEERERARK